MNAHQLLAALAAHPGTEHELRIALRVLSLDGQRCSVGELLGRCKGKDERKRHALNRLVDANESRRRGWGIGWHKERNWFVVILDAGDASAGSQLECFSSAAAYMAQHDCGDHGNGALSGLQSGGDAQARLDWEKVHAAADGHHVAPEVAACHHLPVEAPASSSPRGGSDSPRGGSDSPRGGEHTSKNASKTVSRDGPPAGGNIMSCRRHERDLIHEHDPTCWDAAARLPGEGLNEHTAGEIWAQLQAVARGQLQCLGCRYEWKRRIFENSIAVCEGISLAKQPGMQNPIGVMNDHFLVRLGLKRYNGNRCEWLRPAWRPSV